MAYLGWFDGELRNDAWFDAELQSAAWFDTEIVLTTTGVVYDAILKRWNGSSWVKAKLKHYNGSFVPSALKYWDGSAWATVDVTGV